MALKKTRRISGLISALLLMAAAPTWADEADEASAHDPHAAHRQMMHSTHEPGANGADLRIPDAMLTDQEGRHVNLLTDIAGQNIVVMDFVYTTCTTVCPVLSAILSQVQDEVSDLPGDEVVLVSLTVDPLRDTPERLKEYSAKFGAGEEWHWLTSDKQTMDGVLKQLGAYTPNFEDHPSMVLVGDAQTGEWSRFVGFPSSRGLVEKIHDLRAARAAAHHH